MAANGRAESPIWAAGPGLRLTYRPKMPLVGRTQGESAMSELKRGRCRGIARTVIAIRRCSLEGGQNADTCCITAQRASGAFSEALCFVSRIGCGGWI